MFTIERKVGRLVESIMHSRVTLAELEDGDQTMTDIVSSLRGLPVAIIADFRQTKFLLEDHAARLGKIFQHQNQHIERSAILVSASSAIGVLQMERVIREAKNPSRRAFRDANEATSWLDEVLNPQERARLRVVLAGRAA